jgi:hypothetical protein
MAQEICHSVRCGGKHDVTTKAIVRALLVAAGVKQIMQAIDKVSNIKKCPTTTAIRSQMKTSC